MRRFASRIAWIALLILLVTGTISFALGIYDYRKSILDTAEQEIFFEYNPEFLTFADQYSKGGDEDFLEACVGILFGDNRKVRGAWLYNTETGHVSSAEGNSFSEEHPEYFFSEKPDEKVLEDIRLGRTVKYRIIDEGQYSYKTFGKYRVVIFHDIRDHIREIDEKLPRYELRYAITAVIASAVILSLQRIKKDILRHTLTMTLLFVWVFGISASMFAGTYQFYAHNKEGFKAVVLKYIDKDLERVNEIPEDEVAQFCEEMCRDEDIKQFCAENYPEEYGKSGNPRLELAVYYCALYVDDEYISFIEVGDDILNQDIPISNRVSIVWADNKNEITECLTRTLTVSALALVLYYEWLDYLKKKRKIIKSGEEVRQFQASVAAQGLAAGLVNAVMVVMLAEKAANAGYPVASVVAVLTVVMLAAAPLRHYFVSRMLKKYKSFRLLRIVNASAVLAGFLLCALAPGLALYAVGFVLVKVCGGEVCAFKYVYIQIKNNSRKAGVEICDIINSYSGGVIAGVIITGIVAGVVPGNALYLIGAAFVLISLWISAGCKVSVDNPDFPKADFGKVLSKKKKVLLFLILIIVIMGAMNYYYEYAVPIAVRYLDYSPGVISFVYLIYNLCTYIAGYLWTGTAIGRIGMDPEKKAVLFTVIEAAMLILMVLVPSLLTISLMMAVFGVCDGFTNGMISALAKVSGQPEIISDLNALGDTAKRSGSFLTSAAVGAGLPVGVVPCLIIAFPAIYWFVSRKEWRSGAEG